MIPMHTERTRSTMIFQHFLFLFAPARLTVVKGKTELMKQLFSACTRYFPYKATMIHKSEMRRVPRSLFERHPLQLQRKPLTYYFHPGRQKEGNHPNIKLCLVHLIAFQDLPELSEFLFRKQVGLLGAFNKFKHSN